MQTGYLQDYRLRKSPKGGVAEWSNALVLKTRGLVRVP